MDNAAGFILRTIVGLQHCMGWAKAYGFFRYYTHIFLFIL